jgi:hypothetical protein
MTNRTQHQRAQHQPHLRQNALLHQNLRMIWKTIFRFKTRLLSILLQKSPSSEGLLIYR